MAEVEEAVDRVTRGMRQFLTNREAVAALHLEAATQFSKLTEPVAEMVQDWLKALEEATAVEALRAKLYAPSNPLERAARPAQVALEASAYSVTCPTCGARPQEACRTGADPGTHTSRFQAAALQAKAQEAIAESEARLAANKNSEEPAWIYGAEARAAALAAGRSDWQDVTGWPLFLERAHDAAKRFVQQARESLRAAQREELATLNALMAHGAVQKRPMEPQPAEEPEDA